jgi:hypothetical protein
MPRLARQLQLPLPEPVTEDGRARPLAYADLLEDLPLAPSPWLPSKPVHDLLRLLFLAAVLGPLLVILVRAW